MPAKQHQHAVTRLVINNIRIGQSSLLLKDLFFDLLGDDRLKIADNSRERMRSHDRPKTVVSVTDAGGPLSHRF
jgi:hypothetical protein